MFRALLGNARPVVLDLDNRHVVSGDPCRDIATRALRPPSLTSTPPWTGWCSRTPPGNFKEVTQFIQGDTVIHAGGDTITLIGVNPNPLTDANFIVHHDII